MNEYRDIRDYQRRGRHLGESYTLTAWHDDGGVYLSSIWVAARETITNADKIAFESLELAMEHGERRARDEIERGFED